MRRARGEKEAEERKVKEEENQSQEGKSAIDLTAELKRFDEPRLKLLLDFFAAHFLRSFFRDSNFSGHFLHMALSQVGFSKHTF